MALNALELPAYVYKLLWEAREGYLPREAERRDFLFGKQKSKNTRTRRWFLNPEGKQFPLRGRTISPGTPDDYPLKAFRELLLNEHLDPESVDIIESVVQEEHIGCYRDEDDRRYFLGHPSLVAPPEYHYYMRLPYTSTNIFERKLVEFPEPRSIIHLERRDESIPFRVVRAIYKGRATGVLILRNVGV